MSTLNFEKERAEKLAELGSQLRKLREDQSISLEHVSAKTMIQRRLLSAIEEGKLEQLPEPVYTQGFIRRFADSLGLNGAEFASSFPTGQKVQAVRSEWKELPAAQLRPTHLYALYIGLIVAAVIGLNSYFNRQSPVAVTAISPSTTTATPQTTAKTTAKSSQTALQPVVKPAPVTAPVTSTQAPASPTPSVITPSPKPAASVTPKPAASATPKPTATPASTQQPVQVGMTLKQESWVEVVVDGKTEFEGVLPAGTKRTWKAKEKVVISSGNAGGVLAAFNNQPAKPLGDAGAVKTVTFEAKPTPAQSSNPR